MTEAAEAPTVEVQWAYMGRRILSDALVHAWRDHNGSQRLYDKVKGSLVGGIYTIRMVPGGSILTGTEWTGNTVNQSERDEWVLLDRTAYVAKQQAAREKKEAKESFRGIDDLTLGQVRHMLNNAGPQRYAMLSQILRCIGA